MADFPALPLYTDAFLADAGHLDFASLGAYVRLIMLMWRSPRCRIPNDPIWIRKKLACGEDAYDEIVAPIITEFCKTSGNWITQKRLKREYDYLRKTSRTQSDRAKSRWHKEKVSCRSDAGRKPPAMPDACRTHAKPMPPTLPKETTASSLRSDGDASAADPDGVVKPGSPEHDKLLFRLANRCGRRSAPAEFRKLGINDLRIEVLLRDALGQGEPRSYLAGILKRHQKSNGGPKHFNDHGTKTGFSPTMEREIGVDSEPCQPTFLPETE